MCHGAKILFPNLLNKTRKLEAKMDELKKRLREKGEKFRG